MKKSFIIPLALVGLLTASCNFLNVDDYFEDTFSEEQDLREPIQYRALFQRRGERAAQRGPHLLLVHVPGATGSDEAVSCGTFYNGILDVSFPGTELTTDKISYTAMGGWDWNFNVWPRCYKVIRKVNTILPHIDEVPDMNAFDKMEFRARARFLRAYAYYWILQNQGPMILVGDQVFNTNSTPDYYQPSAAPTTSASTTSAPSSKPLRKASKPSSRWISSAARPKAPRWRWSHACACRPRARFSTAEPPHAVISGLSSVNPTECTTSPRPTTKASGLWQPRRPSASSTWASTACIRFRPTNTPCHCRPTCPRPSFPTVRAASTPSAPTRKCSPAKRRT